MVLRLGWVLGLRLGGLVVFGRGFGLVVALPIGRGVNRVHEPVADY